MRKASSVARKVYKAIEDLNLLKFLQSEIQHELSSNPFATSRPSSLGDFVMEWDSTHTQDVLLKRTFESGEEVAVSAKLGYFSYQTGREGSLYPRDVDMKICVKKPGLSSFLQFDCSIYESYNIGSDWEVCEFYYLHSPDRIGPSVYRGQPSDRPYRRPVELNFFALKEYLEAKGIGEELTNFILHHLHKKEQGQYVNWLQKLESFVAKPE